MADRLALVATQEERTARTTAALRRAARVAFGRDGFDSVSVDEIAAAAGVTRGAFYHHFSSKEAIFEETFEEVEDELARHAMAAAAKGRDPREQLRLGCLAFIDRSSSSRYRRIALIDGPIVLGVTRYREIDTAHFLDTIETAVRAIQPARSSTETTLLARVLLAAICECALSASERPHDRAAAEAVVEDLVRAV